MEKIALEEHFRVPEMPEYSALGQYFPDPTLARNLDVLLADFDALRLHAMDEAGITKSILGHTVPGIGLATEKDKAVADATKINDFLAERIARHPKRLGGFAALPMQSPLDAAKELERCVKELRFHGAMINGHTHGHYLDEAQHLVFWERVADLGVPIYLHPTTAWQVPQNFQDHPELLLAFWGWAPETATHALRLVMAGLFDRFPTLQIILGHGGEGLPYFLWRLDSRFKTIQSTIKKLPSAYLRENVLITTAGLCSTPALRCAVEELGEDRVMFSVDYPYESSKDSGEWLDKVDLGRPGVLQKIASGNAKRHLRI
jgi:2,3-dihydroxybenzoate decarboxylase